LLAASIDPARRGETLSIDDFVRLLQRSAHRSHATPEATPHIAEQGASAG
jgi:16S rRNA (adenine1518-N6/adenine1519-N6)-dimethyltransferase